MGKAVAYCRVSTDQEQQKLSIKEQQKQWAEIFEKENMEFAQCGCVCSKNTSYKARIQTNGLYVDEGITGTSTKRRKAFEQMIDDAKMGKFTDIFVEDVTRFSRNIADFADYINQLIEIGVVVHFRKENINTNDSRLNSTTLNVHAAFAQSESEFKSERQKWSYGRYIDNLIKDNEYCGWRGRTPFGYKLENGQICIDVEKSEIIKYMFDLYVNQHYGTGRMSKLLTEQGIPTPQAKYWNPNAIQRILTNPIYVGRLIVHKTTSTSAILRKPVPTNEEVEVSRPQLRMIDDSTFELAQKQLEIAQKELTEWGHRPKSQYIFSGLLVCDYCGSRLIRNRRRTRDEKYCWVCSLYNSYGHASRKQFSRCPGDVSRIAEDDLLAAVKSEINAFKKENFNRYGNVAYGNISRIEYAFNKYLYRRFSWIDNADIDEIKSQYRELSEDIKQLNRQARLDTKNQAIYDEQIKEIADKMSELRVELRRIENLENDKKYCLELFKKYKKDVCQIDTENLTNEVLKNIFHQIRVKFRLIDGKKVPYVKYLYKFLDNFDLDELATIDEYDEQGNLIEDDYFDIWYRVTNEK